MGIPDLRYIHRKIPIVDVARALNLRIGTNGNIHCWHPEQHQHGDRTASVGIRKINNTVKCFGFGVGPLSVVDLVMAVLQLKNPGAAARWSILSGAMSRGDCCDLRYGLRCRGRVR